MSEPMKGARLELEGYFLYDLPDPDAEPVGVEIGGVRYRREGLPPASHWGVETADGKIHRAQSRRKAEIAVNAWKRGRVVEVFLRVPTEEGGEG